MDGDPRQRSCHPLAAQLRRDQADVPAGLSPIRFAPIQFAVLKLIEKIHRAAQMSGITIERPRRVDAEDLEELVAASPPHWRPFGDVIADGSHSNANTQERRDQNPAILLGLG